MKFANLKRKIAAVAAGLAIAGTVGASAATLGGVGGDDLGADTGDVGACDTDGIDVDWTPVYDAASAQYVARFTLRDIDLDCLGERYQLTIFEDGVDGARAQGRFTSFNGTIYTRPSGGQVFRASYTSRYPAELVDGIALEVGGADF